MLMKGKEVYHNQLLDLAALLGPAYSQVGVGRDDGEQAGEYSPIFYNGERLRVVKWKTLWLSPTPDVPGSKGWDAVRPRLPLVVLRPMWGPQSQTRIATLLTLRHVDSGELVHVVNTHYDDRGTRARAESSLMIREHAHRWVTAIEGDDAPGPVILLGDFSEPVTIYIPPETHREQTLPPKKTGTGTSPRMTPYPTTEPRSPSSTRTSTSAPASPVPRPHPANQRRMDLCTRTPDSPVRAGQIRVESTSSCSHRKRPQAAT